MICMLTLRIHGYNNRGDEDDQRRGSTGRRKPDEGDGALWFVYSTDRDRGVYQDPGAGVSVYAATFVYDVSWAYLGEPERGLLGGAVCAPGARGGAGLYGGRRPFVYFQPTFGYLIGFIAGAWLAGWISERSGDFSFGKTLFANLAGLLVVYLFGMVYVYIINNFYLGTPIGIWPVVLYCFVLAVPGDICLCILAAMLASRLKRAIGK